MLQPAIKYVNRLNEMFNELWFQDKYKFWNNCSYYGPMNISDNTWERNQFVSVTNDGRIIGYIGYDINREINSVFELSVVNFTDNASTSVEFACDLKQALTDIFEKYKFRKLRFSVVIGNPAEKSYDKIINKFGGRIVGIYKDEVKLIDGNYYDVKLYEITADEYFNSKNARHKNSKCIMTYDEFKRKLDSGKITSDYIGTTVKLSNSAIECQEWIIADVNHDNTTGTVDLFSKYALDDNRVQFGSSQIYNGSNLDAYLDYIVYNGFSDDIKNALDLMDVESNGETIQRHIVAPSLRELGNSYSGYYVLSEGTMYPIFSPASNPNKKSIYKMPNGDIAYYWTRSQYTDHINCVLSVSTVGSDYYTYCTDSRYVVARIRFKAK